MKLNLWLDGSCRVPTFIESGLVWTPAKTGDEAIGILQTGNVEFASLDDDLATGSYFDCEHSAVREEQRVNEKTGWDVMTWMTENNVWPKTGVRIHAANRIRRDAMISLVKSVYGRTFQYPFDRLSSRSEDISEDEDAASAKTY